MWIQLLDSDVGVMLITHRPVGFRMDVLLSAETIWLRRKCRGGGSELGCSWCEELVSYDVV